MPKFLLRLLCNFLFPDDTQFNLLFYNTSVAQVIHSYYRRLPALGRFYRETKVDPLNLDFDLDLDGVHEL